MELELAEHQILNKNNEVIFGHKFNSTGKIDIESVFLPDNILQKSRLDIVKEINNKHLCLYDIDNSKSILSSFEENAVASFCLNYIGSASKFLCRQLLDDKIFHVSPLRALPQRYYLLEKSVYHNTINSYDGTQVTEVLKNNSKVRDLVNDFFKDFNIKIKTERVRDVIHKIAITQDGINVDLTDVGFGISQVLPILVQVFLCKKDSIIIIEQPEIHLHPNMQALLATLLAKIAVSSRKKLIIETHSETIIRRLQRLYLDPEFKLSQDDLRIYQFTRNQDGSSKAQCDTLGYLGEIKWLKGFKEIEIEDTIAIQKLRTDKISREGHADE
ncbi:hypothetical protein DX883_06435 [Vibrio fluvialis]|nr:hypothetical protein [Vibrio fluvialis]